MVLGVQSDRTDGAYLRVRDVGKRFGAFTALDRVSIEIGRGEFVCFLGPSGCGKTTLLRIIAGLEVQSEGRIEQAGRDISTLPPAQRDFGIVFQSYALFPNLSVAANVGYGLVSRKRPKGEIAARVAELLALVGMPEAGEKYPAQLSGGQQQRVALARALATSPGLLLLDEPLSALDARVRIRLRHEIRQIQRRLGLTTIMVTHDQEEALGLADRIVVMNQGSIEQVGSPAEIYGQPASPFVADFVGAMNFLHGTVTAAGRLQLGQQEIVAPVEGFTQGSEVTLCIRPEDVQTRNVGAATPNALAVTVRGLDFLGPFCRASVEGGGLSLTADFSRNLMHDLGIAEGVELAVALPPARLRVFPRMAR